MEAAYETAEPSRATVDQMEGPVLVEFGSAWCGHCRRAQPLIAAALKEHPGVKHIKVEDGPGQPLGRSFKVKLWPTLVFMNAGKEMAKLVRPQDGRPISEALGQIDPTSPENHQA